MTITSESPTHLAAELDRSEPWLDRTITHTQPDHLELRNDRIALTPHGDEPAHSIAESLGVPVE